MERAEATELINSLFDSWYAILLRHACRLTSNPQMAEDVVQETFLCLYRELARGKRVEFPKAWTLCVMRREVQRLVRDHRKMTPRQSLDHLDDFVAGRVEPDLTALLYDDVSRLFTCLSPRELEVLLLRIETLKYREIADHLGISANSVTTLLSRALRKLQTAAGYGNRALFEAPEEEVHVPETLQ